MTAKFRGGGGPPQDGGPRKGRTEEAEAPPTDRGESGGWIGRRATPAGWLSPSEGDGSAGTEAPEAVLSRRDNIGRLSVQAQYSGWRTPVWKDAEHRERGLEVRRPPWELPYDLRDYAMQAGWDEKMEERLDPESRVYAIYLPAGWQTPQARDVKGGCQGGRVRDGEFRAGGLDQMAQTVIPETPGLTAVGSIAGTARSARLNPAFSRWLMGFPEEWDSCGVTAMQSCRKSARRSSKRSSKPKEKQEAGDE